MKFTSKAHVKRCRELVASGEMKQSTFDQHMKDTPDYDGLPDRADGSKPKHLKVGKVKVIK